MDFSSLNPLSSNALNLAARNNDVKKVERLLKKMNPNCIDSRGWTCLHEAAATDSYQSLLLILKHSKIRPLAETHEGHTALYLACRYRSSVQTIKALLDSVPDLANYGSTENVTPLHISSSQGRLEVIELLIQYGAMANVQDFDGDTPLHDAALSMQYEAVNLLLHVGADPEIKNDADYTAFHLACYKDCLITIKNIYPFINDINQVTVNGDSPLILATQGCNDDIVKFLLKNGADPHIKNKYGEEALVMALNMGHSSCFKILLSATCPSKIDPNIILYACKPLFFKMEILECLLAHNLGPEFFDFYEQFFVQLEDFGDYKPAYLINAPINSYLNICEYIYVQSQDNFRKFFYFFLMGGVSVNPVDVNECPPLVYIHYCMHTDCFHDVFEILREHGCNVDYCTTIPSYTKKQYISDALLASLTANPVTLLHMLPYSLYCDPEYVLRFACVNGILNRIPLSVQNELLSMIGIDDSSITPESITCTVLPLTHLSRQQIRCNLRNTGNTWITTDQFLHKVKQINLPQVLKEYICYCRT